jgi:hypothetical protein
VWAGNTGSFKFTFTHAHTRLAKGNTGSVKFTVTHASHSHTLHIHTRFTFTHASHSHTLHTHTRTHTQQPFRTVPHMVFVYLAQGNTGSVKFTSHTHTRDNLFCGETPLARQHAFPRPIACLASAEGLESEYTHIARIENTHVSPVNTLVKSPQAILFVS